MKNAVLVGIIILILWSGFRILSPLTNGLDEVVVKPVIFFSVIFFFNTILEKKSLSDLGFNRQHLLQNILIGAGAAIGLILYKTIILSLRAHGFSFQLASLSKTEVLWAAITSFATALTEEVVFRGYIQHRIYNQTKDLITAVAVSNIFFVITHLPRAIFVLHLSWQDILSYMMLLSFLGIANSLLFWKTKNIATSTTTHWIWNFVVSLIK